MARHASSVRGIDDVPRLADLTRADRRHLLTKNQSPISKKSIVPVMARI
jgi:hypothetical protein